MTRRLPPLNPVAVPANEVPPVDLVRFATRNDHWLGEGFRPPPTHESWQAVLTDRTQRWYAIVDDSARSPGTEQPGDNCNSTVLGLVVFSRWIPPPWRSAEIGFAVDSRLTGQGLIQATVPRLLDAHLLAELARIEALVDPSNVRAAQSLSRLGFKFEGYARGCLDRQNERRTQAQWAIITADRVAARSPTDASANCRDAPLDKPIGGTGRD